jgi:DNA polymerase-1
VPAPHVPLLLVLDGNSLLHRAYHAAATGRLVDRAGRPVWALKGLIGYVTRTAARLRPQAVIVGFDCPEDSARKVDYPLYKSHRPAKPDDLASQLADAPELLRATGVCTIVHRAYEADDVLASSAAQARRSGWRSVLVTSDRDAFALIDATTSVLRLRNGGLDEAVLVTGAALAEIYRVTPGQYRDYAALRGDPSDNLPGVRGLGAARAARLLSAFAGVDEVWNALDQGEDGPIVEAVGEAAARELARPETRIVVERNRRLMRMRTDLPVPEPDSVRLPLDRVRIRRALLARGINLGPSLWPITGGQVPVGEWTVPVPQPRLWTRRSRRLREPTPGQLSLF